MKKREQAPNLVPYMHLLTPNEKAVLCFALNVNNNDGIHQGVLPFVSYSKALVRLASLAGGPSDKPVRMARQILSKLKSPEQGFFEGRHGFVRFLMQLDDVKVYRRFGPNPERGKPMPFLPKEKVTVGLKFSLPKKQYLPDKDVLVSPCVTLKRQEKGLWQVEVLTRCQGTVEEWLVENCR